MAETNTINIETTRCPMLPEKICNLNVNVNQTHTSNNKTIISSEMRGIVVI
jgi:hypothetical protein